MHPLNIFFLPQQTSLSHPACLFCPREFCRCKTRGKPYFVGVRLYIKGTFAQRQDTLTVAAAQKDCYVAPQKFPLRPIKNAAKKIHLPSGDTFFPKNSICLQEYPHPAGVWIFSVRRRLREVFKTPFLPPPRLRPRP